MAQCPVWKGPEKEPSRQNRVTVTPPLPDQSSGDFLAQLENTEEVAPGRWPALSSLRARPRGSRESRVFQGMLKSAVRNLSVFLD